MVVEGKASHLFTKSCSGSFKRSDRLLNVRRGGTYIDATVGLGGHSYESQNALGAPGHLIGSIKIPAALGRRKRFLGVGSSVLGESGSQLPKTYDLRPDWPRIELRQLIFAKFGRSPKPDSRRHLADIGLKQLAAFDAARGFSFQAMDRSTCGWTRGRSELPNKCKPPRRARACRCDYEFG